MNEERSVYMKVGLFVGGTLAVLALLIFFIGDEQNLFLKMNRYTLLFTSAEGLDVGNPVKLNGVKVGRITAINLPLEPEESKITIEVAIDKRYNSLIRTDSRARIRSLGLLGDKYIEITGGSTDTSCLIPGGMIPSIEPTDMTQLLSRGEDTMDNLLAISTSLKDILDHVSRGDSPVTSIMERANSSLGRLDRILARLERGTGTAGKLISDPDFGAEILGNLQQASRNLKTISETMAQDLSTPGTVYDQLMRDQAAGERTAELIENLSEISSALARISDTLEARDNALLPRLMKDEAFAREFLNDLQRAADHIASIAEKVDKGDGSASLLINDPSIYEGIHHVLYGINQSKFISWYIRKKREKGEKADEP
ncbi:MAG TPA: MlaD family protein [Thermoanaerobaculia bacterium]|nr:MlaD family protein [Thermoanaerobaculia bacterium]HUM30557.1 MlaD family protein [Thermoanaerobaculia bacterium]HXK68749.1 MlaD family protein [Thermoanaerobaculia bacterium]